MPDRSFSPRHATFASGADLRTRLLPLSIVVSLFSLGSAEAADTDPLLADMSSAFILCLDSFALGSVAEIAELSPLEMMATSVNGAHGKLPNGQASVQAMVKPRPSWSDEPVSTELCEAYDLLPPHDELRNAAFLRWSQSIVASADNFAVLEQNDERLAGLLHWTNGEQVLARFDTAIWLGFEILVPSHPRATRLYPALHEETR